MPLAQNTMFFNIPNTLTWARIAAIPLLLAVFHSHWGSIHWQNLVAAALFAGFGITDWLDGFCARKFKQESLFGKVFDPIADKTLMIGMFATLVVMSDEQCPSMDLHVVGEQYTSLSTGHSLLPLKTPRSSISKRPDLTTIDFSAVSV